MKISIVSVFALFVFCTNLFAGEFTTQSSYELKVITESLIDINTSKKKKEKIEELELLAENFTDKKFYNRAIDIYKRILCQNLPKKKLFKYYVKIGDLYIFKKEYILSLDYYKEALSIHKKSSEVMVKIGRIFLEGNLFTIAEKMFLDALKTDKHSIEAKRGLGDTFYKQGIYIKAIDYYNQIPKELYDRKFVKNITDSLSNLNKINEAIAILEPFLKEHGDPDLMFDLGMIGINKMDYAFAEDWFLKSLKMNGDNFKDYIYLAFLYDLKGESKKALKMSNKAYAIDSSYSVVDFMRAKTAYKMGRINEAKVYANEAYNKAKTIFVKDQAQKLLKYLNNK
jgi:tetratricopeptide (TPR) repeat protein